MTWTTLFLIWSGDVALPTMGRKIRKVAVTADGARRRVAAADWHGLMENVEPRRLTEQVVDIADLSRRAGGARAKAAAWLTEAGTTEGNGFGGFAAMPPHAADGEIETDGTERDHRDKLAS
jgi:hypothetical protein